MSATVVGAPAMTRRIPAGLMGLGRSVLINFVGPAVLLGIVGRWFAHDSAAPLLICALIPVAELLVMYRRRGVVDTVAIISITQLSVGIIITLVTGNVRLALGLHALQAAALGLVFGGSAAIGRPLMRGLARQSMAGDDRALQVQFDARTDNPVARGIFFAMSMVWMIALCAQGAALFVASRMMATASYLLLSHVVSYGVLGVLIWGSVRYGRYRGRKAAA